MTEAAWAKIAAHHAYDRTLPHWSKYQALMAETIQLVGDAPRVLDAGCGSGILAERIAERGAFVEGVDASLEMVLAAQERTLRFPDPARLRFSQQDASMLAFGVETFDAVVSTNVVFAVRAPLAYLTELRRVLRPGGRLAISGPTPTAASHVEALAADLRRELELSGKLVGLEGELAVVTQVNRALAARSFGWTYSAERMAQTLRELGFDVNLSHERHYDAALYFVGATKRA